jgi:hypothetical protein
MIIWSFSTSCSIPKPHISPRAVECQVLELFSFLVPQSFSLFWRRIGASSTHATPTFLLAGAYVAFHFVPDCTRPLSVLSAVRKSSCKAGSTFYSASGTGCDVTFFSVGSHHKMHLRPLRVQLMIPYISLTLHKSQF